MEQTDIFQIFIYVIVFLYVPTVGTIMNTFWIALFVDFSSIGSEQDKFRSLPQPFHLGILSSCDQSMFHSLFYWSVYILNTTVYCEL